MSVQVRRAGPSDLESIEVIENEADRLLIELLRPDRWEPAPPGASRLSREGYVLVAEVGSGLLAGFAHVVEVDGLAHLEQLSVSPAHGRHGYGRMLIDAAKGEARRRGYARLSLRTYPDVPWNAPFYARAGFVEEEATTPFHRGLIELEARLGLDEHGRRVQLAAELS